MKILELLRADPSMMAELVPQLFSSRLAVPDLELLQGLTSNITAEEWDCLVPQLLGIGDEHRIYPAHQGLRRVSRLWMHHLLLDRDITGAEHLKTALAAGPTILVTNHLSYVDANVKDALIEGAVGAKVADRVAFLAGPKVYTDPFRRLSVAGITSLPVPQSQRLDHNDRQLPARELVVRTLQTVEASKAHLEDGGLLVFYPEGSRSRNGRLGTFFKGTRRFLKSAVRLVPAALVGTDQVMAIRSEKIRRAAVGLHFAPAVNLETTGAREALAEAFDAISARLPTEMKPEHGTPILQ